MMLALPLTAGCSDDPSASEPSFVTPDDAETPQEVVTVVETLPPTDFNDFTLERADIIVVDLRTPEQVAAGRVPQADLALDINSADIEARLAELETDQPYAIYDQSGDRIAAAADLMEHAGFAKIYELDGGFDAWSDARLPVSTDQL